MLSFFLKILLVLFTIVLLVVIIPNPLQNQFPQWIKKYENYKDPLSNNILELDQLEIMSQDPLKCYKNADCFLILCGKIPNCNSIALNNEYFNSKEHSLPSKYQCPSEFDGAVDCSKNAELDTFAACEKGQCVKKRLFPQPTSSTSHIIENITNGK